MDLSKKEVIKHSAAIQIHNRINLLQRKAWNVLLANAYDDLPVIDEYRVKVSDLAGVLDFASKNFDYLKDNLKALVGCLVEWNILNKDKQEWVATTLLSQAKIVDNTVYYSYSPALREKLFNPSMYARIKLSIQQRFSSKHTLALYEVCLDYLVSKLEKGETPWIEIEKYRQLMGVAPAEYQEFKELNRWVIKEPVKEINKKSDITVTVEYKRNKRKVSQIKFLMRTKPRKEGEDDIAARPLALPDGTNVYLFERLTKYFQLSDTQARDVLKSYEEDYITENLAYVEARYKKGEITNLGAYTTKALSENYSHQISLFEIERKEEEARKKEELADKRRLEDLQRDYAILKQKAVSDYRALLSPAELAAKEEQARKEAMRQFGAKNPGIKMMVRVELENILAQEAGLPSFEEWAKG